MIKKIQILFVLLLTTSVALNSCSTSKSSVSKPKQEDQHSTAYNSPDYQKIKKAINVADSEFYYPELLKRFQAVDTTLTLEQVRHFYYGAAMLPDYNPYQTDLSKELKEALEKNDLQQAASIIDKQLAKTPTNLRFYLQKTMVNSSLYGEESKEAEDAFSQFNMLLSAILSSGNGKSTESAIYVTNIADEYGILSFLGLTPTMQSLIKEKGELYDRLELKNNEIGLKTLYFNTTIMQKAFEK